MHVVIRTGRVMICAATLLALPVVPGCGHGGIPAPSAAVRKTVCDEPRPGHRLPPKADDDEMTSKERDAFSAKVIPSTVEVMQYVTDAKGKQNPFSGTGAVVDDRGSVFTSYHVVKRDGPIYVAARYIAWHGRPAADFRKRVKMRIAGFSDESASGNDIAWLVPDTGEKPLEAKPLIMARNRWYVLGERLWQLGKQSHWAFGRLSNLIGDPRRARGFNGLLEMASATIAGDSGAPVVDAKPEMVGVLIATCFGKKETYIVPIDVARKAVGYR